jgi:hypothetical protein
LGSARARLGAPRACAWGRFTAGQGRTAISLSRVALKLASMPSMSTPSAAFTTLVKLPPASNR